MIKPGRNSIRPLFCLFWCLVWAFISIIFVELHALRSFLFPSKLELQTRPADVSFVLLLSPNLIPFVFLVQLIAHRTEAHTHEHQAPPSPFSFLLGPITTPT